MDITFLLFISILLNKWKEWVKCESCFSYCEQGHTYQVYKVMVKLVVLLVKRIIITKVELDVMAKLN